MAFKWILNESASAALERVIRSNQVNGDPDYGWDDETVLAVLNAAGWEGIGMVHLGQAVEGPTDDLESYNYFGGYVENPGAGNQRFMVSIAALEETITAAKADPEGTAIEIVQRAQELLNLIHELAGTGQIQIEESTDPRASQQEGVTPPPTQPPGPGKPPAPPTDPGGGDSAAFAGSTSVPHSTGDGAGQGTAASLGLKSLDGLVPVDKIEVEFGMRAAEFSLEGADIEKRTVPMVFSSEAPAEKGFGIEILSHERGHVRLGKLAGAPLLVNHDIGDQIGVVEEGTIDSTRRGRATVRFGRSARAEEFFQDVLDGIRRQVSVGYRILQGVRMDRDDQGRDTFLITDWEPYELSVMSVSADPINTGFAVRGEYGQPNTLELFKQEEGPSMEDKNKAVEPQGDENRAAATPPAPDVKVVREEAEKAANTRAAAIVSLGQKYGLPDLAVQAVSNGTSLDEFRGMILDHFDAGKVPGVTPAGSPGDAGITEKEAQQYSYVKAFRACALGGKYIEEAAYEREIGEAGRVAAKASDRGGFYVPHEVLKQKFPVHGARALTVGDAASAGNLVDDAVVDGSSFIDLLLDNSVIVPNATLLTNLNGSLAIPRATKGATTYWVPENQNITIDDPEFDQVPLAPKTVGAVVEMGRKLILQSSIDIEAWVRNEIARRIALAIDAVAINGGGANEPSGILQGSIAAVTGGLTWANVVDLWAQLATDNAAMGDLYYVTDALVAGAAMSTPKEAGQALYIMGDGFQMAGFNTLISNQMPVSVNDHTLIFGNLKDVLVGMWGGLYLLNDPYSNSLSGALRVVGMHEVDVNLRHPESFSAISDITIT